jgi:hypothetical protein
MIKQIKKRLVGVILVSFTCISVIIAPPARISDVVENKSVIDEQIILQLNEELTVDSTGVKEERYYDGWTTTKVRVRKGPSINTTVLTTYDFNTHILYTEYDNEWVKIKYDGSIAYMAKQFISDKECEYHEISVPSHEDFKSYMGYKTITDKKSTQYKIQSNYAYTGDYGIRQADGRFCVALGSYFNVEIGQYFDLVLENGTIIPCVKGDSKADCDTDNQNIFTKKNGCCSEFIIDSNSLASSIKNKGNISYANEEWKSQVVAIRVYEENVLD